MKYILVLMIFFSVNSYANFFNPGKRISNLILKKLNHIEKSFEDSSSLSTPFLYQGEDETAYYLKRIRLQFASSIAFDIKIFEVKFKPVIEFRWNRKNPVGWQNYKKFE